jgi:hypothetical protein
MVLTASIRIQSLTNRSSSGRTTGG